MNNKQTYLKNVLHVPTITKNLVSVGQIVEQDMQVRFNHEGCFIEKDGQLVGRGRRDGVALLYACVEKTRRDHRGLELKSL